MDRPGVTVVIPTLKRASLVTALASIAREPRVQAIAVVANRTAPEGRNDGARSVETTHVLFMDDDVVAAPGAIAAGLGRMVDRGLQALAPKIEGGLVSSPTCVFAGAAMFATAELVRSLPFDEDLPMVEDLDWAWRVMESGATWEYWEGANFYHVGPNQVPTWSDPKELKQVTERLKDKHPERYAWLVDHDSSVLGLKPGDARDIRPGPSAFNKYEVKA